MTGIPPRSVQTRIALLAEAFLDAGELVVPLVWHTGRGRYIPAVKGWPNASPEERRAWINRARWHGIGLVTTGRLVVDVDGKNDATLVDVVGLEYGVNLETPSGGQHIHLRLPDDVEARSVQGWRPGIDLIAGSRAFVPVGPTPGYRNPRFMLADLLTANLPLAPDELVRVVRNGLPARKRNGTAPSDNNSWRTIARASTLYTTDGCYRVLREHVKQVENAPPGQQRYTLNRVAFLSGKAAAKGGLSVGAAEYQLVRAGMKMANWREDWPWTEAEVRQIVRQGIIDGWLRIRAR